MATADSSASSLARRLQRNDSRPQPGANLNVIRGRRLNVDYPLYEGANLIGRATIAPSTSMSPIWNRPIGSGRRAIMR